jgi:hypothetical protein
MRVAVNSVLDAEQYVYSARLLCFIVPVGSSLELVAGRPVSLNANPSSFSTYVARPRERAPIADLEESASLSTTVDNVCMLPTLITQIRASWRFGGEFTSYIAMKAGQR